jgi:hypothetical protein
VVRDGDILRDIFCFNGDKHKVLILIEYHSVCPLVGIGGIGTLPPFPPLGSKGGYGTLTCG